MHTGFAINGFFALVAVLLAPLFLGIANMVKAFFSGCRGPGFFRLYSDIAKLLSKSCPRSATSTWVFDIAPSATLAAALTAAFLFPWSQTPMGGILGAASPVLFFYLLGTGRFFTVLGALDTGSAFEGMGASREVQFSAIAELAVFIILGFLALPGGADSLSGILAGGQAPSVPLLLAATAFFAILLSECSRVPFDDPETHLELTMVHEAMILDNSGPDLAFIHLGAAVKFELLAAFLAAMLMPDFGLGTAGRFAVLLCGVALCAVLTGVVESCIARCRFLKSAHVLLSMAMLASLGTLLYILFRP